MIASEMSNIDAINVLLKAGADPNIADAQGDTCLHHTVRTNYKKEVLQAITDHGADLIATNKMNWTALMIASAMSYIDDINVLLKAGADPNIANTYGDTCLHDAVSAACDKEVLQAIIEHGADVNAANKNSETALMMAREKSNAAAIHVLLNAGADPNIANADGYTSLHHTVRKNYNKEVFQAIIDHGADVNARNKKNWTALKIASAISIADAVYELLKAGADPNIADAHVDTCLHHLFISVVK